MGFSIAVDIGGTFTDVVLRHSTGVLTVDKVLTTPHDLLEGFFLRRRECAEGRQAAPRDSMASWCMPRPSSPTR